MPTSARLIILVSHGGSLGGDDRRVHFRAITEEPIIYKEDMKEEFPDADAIYEALEVAVNRDYYKPEGYVGGESSSTYSTYSQISVPYL